MLRKTKLYFDLVRRLTPTQIYYLFKNRIKTKLIPSLFYKKRVKKIDYIKFQEFLTNAKRIVYIQEDSIPIWSARREISREKQHYYFNELNTLLEMEQQTAEEP
ncbi:hypothetical protein KY334_04235, partial [Candidatus Woesearchaeota archaeon]|nr:hypothetical protein [Candidatus Woesearchaeota archaeon]